MFLAEHQPERVFHARIDGEVDLPALHPQQLVHRPWLLRGFDRAGRPRWSGRFRSRAEADFFRALGNLGLLRRDREMWRLPHPMWNPDFGDELRYEFAISVTGLTPNSSIAGATLAVGAGSGIPAGSLVVFGASNGSSVSWSTGGTVNDASSNSYAQITHQNNNNTASLGFGAVFYAFNITALAALANITWTKQTSGNFVCASAIYATGIDTGSPLDTAVTATGFGSGTALTKASGAPAAAGELFVGFGFWRNVNDATLTTDTTNGWATPPTGTTTGSAGGDQCGIGGGSQINAGVGAITFAPTISASNVWAEIIVGFKPLSIYAPSIENYGAMISGHRRRRLVPSG